MHYIPYFSHPKVTITIFVDGYRFFPLKKRANEVFILRDSWYPSDEMRAYMKKYQRTFHPDPAVHWYLSNTEEIHKERLRCGMNSHFININCFIDEDVFKPVSPILPKEYDAVMVARFSKEWRGGEVKRHHLAVEVPKIALLDPIFGTDDLKSKAHYVSLPNCAYHNDERLSPNRINIMFQRSYCGLILSEIEGACRASSEYLLAGIPVVSTRSKGGRDVWYDGYNSIIADDDPKSVAAAVAEFKAHPRDPQKIRQSHLDKAQMFRNRFRDEVIAPILAQYGVDDITAEEVVRSSKFEWWGINQNIPNETSIS